MNTLLQRLSRLGTAWLLIVSFTATQTLTWIKPEEAEAASVDEAKATCDMFMKEVAAGEGTGSLNLNFSAGTTEDVEGTPELSARAIFARCSPPDDVKKAVTTLSVKASAIPTSNPENPEFEDCKNRVINSWKTLAPHCIVIQKSDIGVTAQYVAMFAYLAAGALCLISMIVVAANSWNFSGQWGKGLFFACMALGAVGFVADVTAVIQVASSDGGSGAGVSSLSAVGGAFGVLIAIVPALVSDVYFIDAAGYIDAYAGLVVATILFFALAAIKLASINNINSTRDKSAHEIGVLSQDLGQPVAAGGMTFTPPPSNPQVGAGGSTGGGSGGGASSGGGSGGRGGGGGPLDAIASDLGTQSGLEKNFNASSAFSKSDPIAGKITKDGKLLGGMNTLKAAGGDLVKSASEFLKGKGVAGAMNGMGGAFAQAAQMAPGFVAQIDKLATEDFGKTKLASELVKSGLIPSVGGGSVAKGGGAAAAPNPFAAMFGAKTPASDAAAIAKFGDDKDKKKKNPLDDLPESTDIWHGGDARSIFQIISRRIDKTRDRTHTLDWESKLNRAIHGSLMGAKPGAGAGSLSPAAKPSPQVK